MDDASLEALFVEESVECLSTLTAAVLILERDPDDRGAIDAAFRAAHTLKGNARLMQRVAIANCAHEVESVLDGWRRGELVPNPVIVTTLFEGIDRLEELITGQSSQSQRPPSTMTVRLPVERVNRLVGIAEDLWYSRVRERTLIHDLARMVDGFASTQSRDTSAEARRLFGQIQTITDRVATIQTTLDDSFDRLLVESARIRTLPLATVTAGFRREVRDLAQSRGKMAELVMFGEDVELDKGVLEAMSDPLLHLIRNAVDHGIESPDERRIRSKSPVGRIEVTARLRGDRAVITISDDGAGIDPDDVAAVARDRGILAKADVITPAAAFELLFAPGFSTRSEVTDLSGRGVGLDVVRTKVSQARGSVRVRSELGVGTTFELHLPLSLSQVMTLVFVVADYVLALPLSNVVSVEPISGPRPDIYRLPFGRSEATKPPATGAAVVVATTAGRVVLHADRLVSDALLMLRPLGPLFRATRLLSAGAILDDGTTVLVLDPDQIVAGETRPA